MEKKQGALTITRRIGEQIFLGDNIVLTISDIRGKQVRIRILAPGIHVRRSEVEVMPDGRIPQARLWEGHCQNCGQIIRQCICQKLIDTVRPASQNCSVCGVVTYEPYDVGFTKRGGLFCSHQKDKKS